MNEENRAWTRAQEYGRVGGRRSGAVRRAKSRHRKQICVCLQPELIEWLDSLARRAGHGIRSLVLEEAIESYREAMIAAYEQAMQHRRALAGQKPSASGRK
jgi:predicted DNA-binding protein